MKDKHFQNIRCLEECLDRRTLNSVPITLKNVLKLCNKDVKHIDVMKNYFKHFKINL